MIETFTASQKFAALKREIAQRHRVYSRLVASGKMKPAESAREIGVMTAIAEDYRAQAEAEDRAGRLI